MILSAYRLVKKPYNILLSSALACVVGISSFFVFYTFKRAFLWDFFFLVGFIISTPIYLYVFRKIKLNDYKLLFIFSLIITLIILWEMEAPQRMLFYTLTKDKTMYDIEIVDDNYTLPVDYKRFSIGYAKPYNDCVDDPSKCPLLPMPHQLKHYVDENRNGKEVMIAKLYGPYYASTYLMLFFDTFKDGGGITYEKSFYVDSEKVFQYLENLKLENQKIKNLANKGENNGNK